jgi:hypothetical protein
MRLRMQAKEIEPPNFLRIAFLCTIFCRLNTTTLSVRAATVFEMKSLGVALTLHFKYVLWVSW